MNRPYFASWALAVLASAAGVVAEDGVKVSGFGYDPVDSTRFIQAALDSRHPKIVLDRQAGPWYTQPLKGRSGKEFVLEPGVELVAKRGAFLTWRDCLLELSRVTNFSLRCGEGSVFRMWKEDYRKPPYEPSEWRHGLRIMYSQNVLVEGLRIENTGGDGVCIGYSRNVTVRKCVCDGNHRQGLTLGSGENVLIENVVTAGTEGTPPQAGVDVEPNGPKDYIINCVFRNCLSTGNAGCGYEINLRGLCASKSPPVSLAFENCRTVGNRVGLKVTGGPGKENDFATGWMAFRNCSFENTKGTGISVMTKPADAFDVKFENCCVSNASTAVSMCSARFGQGQPDGIDLGNLTVHGARDGMWYMAGKQGVGPAPTRIKGRAKVVAEDGSSRTEEIDAAWIARNIPVVNGGRPMPPRCDLPTMKDVVSIHDDAPGEMVDLAPIMCTAFSTGRYIFLVDKPRTVRFRGRQIVIYRNAEPETAPLNVIGLDGAAKRRSWNVARPGIRSGEFSFEAPAAGFYALRTPCRKMRFAMEAADVPIAIDVSEHDCQIAPAGDAPVSLMFEVPQKRGFALMVSGDSYYHFSATVRDPDGKLRFADGLVDKVVVHSEESVARQGFWTLELARAAKPRYDVIGLDLTGVNGTLFLSHRKTWSCAPVE